MTPERLSGEAVVPGGSPPSTIPALSYGQLFRRFLGFGAIAWGGPFAQIAMIHEELVVRQRWIDEARFKRALAVYQALPGPEAHELCIYFGMLARGRPGGILAGLGFMLPGLLAMLVLASVYVTFGISPVLAAAFAGLQLAATALLARGAILIGQRALGDRSLWLIAIAAAIATALGTGFIVVLLTAGVMRFLVVRRWRVAAWLTGVALVGLSVMAALGGRAGGVGVAPVEPIAMPTTVELFGAGLKTGLFTFGGAYTAISVLYQEAVVSTPWMTAQQFLDGIALGGILPAPLVIFGTFAGFVGGGLLGGLALTAGIFLPAFVITLVGHRPLERVVDEPSLHAALEGVVAGVAGLIAVTALAAAVQVLVDPRSVAVFVVAFAALMVWRWTYAVAFVMLGAGMAGLVLFGG